MKIIEVEKDIFVYQSKHNKAGVLGLNILVIKSEKLHK